MQTTRDLVAVLVELAAGMQFGQRNFGCRTLGLMLVVQLDAGRNASAIVDHRNRVIGMDGDDDIVAMTGECFVNRVVDNLENQMMQTSAIGGIADVHARALANRFEAFENLD